MVYEKKSKHNEKQAEKCMWSGGQNNLQLSCCLSGGIQNWDWVGGGVVGWGGFCFSPGALGFHFWYMCMHPHVSLVTRKTSSKLFTFSSVSQTVIFTQSEWSLLENNPKPSPIKFACQSLWEAERGIKKGPFVFLGGRRKRDSRSCSCSRKEKAGDLRA